MKIDHENELPTHRGNYSNPPAHARRVFIKTAHYVGWKSSMMFDVLEPPRTSA